MKNKIENLFVFPQTDRVGDVSKTKGGMTLRDYFAAAALQGLLSNPKVFVYEGDSDKDSEINSTDDKYFITEMAFHYADSMLEEREILKPIKGEKI